MNGIVQVVALIALTAGLIATWVRNSKHQSRRDGALSQQIEDIKDTLKSPDTGLTALNEKISGMQTNCAGVTAAFGQKIKGLEAEVFSSKRK